MQLILCFPGSSNRTKTLDVKMVKINTFQLFYRVLCKHLNIDSKTPEQSYSC